MDYSALSVSNGSGDAALMHVTTDRSIGATALLVDNIVNVPAKFIATYGTLGANGLITPATKVDFLGHISGSNLVIDTFLPGSTDAGNTAGQIVIIKPNTSHTNEMVTLAQVSHNNDGTLKAAAVAGVFALNMKSASNGGSITPTNSDQDLAVNGVTVSFTVAANCKALVTVDIGVNTQGGDFEFRPEVRLNGTVIFTFSPNASSDETVANRAWTRGFSWVVPLVTGVNVLSAGLYLASGSGYTINPNAAVISAIVLGDVTA